jgi:hypothetical protein
MPDEANGYSNSGIYLPNSLALKQEGVYALATIFDVEQKLMSKS